MMFYKIVNGLVDIEAKDYLTPGCVLTPEISSNTGKYNFIFLVGACALGLE